MRRMIKEEEMILDEGYQYGLGAFETIAVYKNKALFLKEHLQRLNNTLKFLGIQRIITEEDVESNINKDALDYHALKVIVSEKNVLFQTKKNPYAETHYEKGFHMRYSDIRRNETSPFVYHKTLNYGECILEKRKALSMNINEMIFLNSKGIICEGTACNIFFVKEGKIYTPDLSCGILPGILRDYICKIYDVAEIEIKPSQVSEFEECFVTNSLMGIMPVRKLEKIEFKKNDITKKIADEYFRKLVKS